MGRKGNIQELYGCTVINDASLCQQVNSTSGKFHPASPVDPMPSSERSNLTRSKLMPDRNPHVWQSKES